MRSGDGVSVSLAAAVDSGWRKSSSWLGMVEKTDHARASRELQGGDEPRIRVMGICDTAPVSPRKMLWEMVGVKEEQSNFWKVRGGLERWQSGDDKARRGAGLPIDFEMSFAGFAAEECWPPRLLL